MVEEYKISRKFFKPFIWLFNLSLILLAIVVVYLSYSFITKQIQTDQSKNISTNIDSTRKVIKIEILNGCGVKKTASKFRLFLQTQGFDVVDIGNYKNFDLEESLVIDRLNNILYANEVAKCLNISLENVIQQIDTNYFAAVSVVIGKDYNQLKPMKEDY